MTSVTVPINFLDLIRGIPSIELGRTDRIELLRDMARAPDLRNEIREAADCAEMLRNKIAELPSSVLSGEIKAVYDEILAQFEIWSAATLPPERVNSLLHRWTGLFLRDSTFDLDDGIPMLGVTYAGFVDPIVRWLVAAQEGIAQCDNPLGSGTMTIYTGAVVPRAVRNWVMDFDRFAGNHPDTIERTIANYLSRSANVTALTTDERLQLERLLRWTSRIHVELIGMEIEEERIRGLRRGQGFVNNAVSPGAPPADLSPRPPALTALDTKPRVYPGALATAPKPTQPRPPTKSPRSLTAPPEQTKDASLTLLGNKVRQSLNHARALIEHYEKAEKLLPPLDQASIGQLAVLANEAIKGGDATRAVAGLFQVARAKGIMSLANDPSFMSRIRPVVGPYLQTIRHISPDLAMRSVDLTPNRMQIVKGFLRILLVHAAGNETNAARVMVHIAGLVPSNLSGSEVTFAYFDLPSEQYRWAETIVDPDGTMHNEIN